MRERWRDFARRDPMRYIAPERRRWTTEAFLASREGVVKDVLEWTGDAIGREAMLEIGCGLGRMLIAFAPHFEEVHGVDIAPEMVQGAKELGLPANVHIHETSGAELAALPDSRFDLVFSFLVFQHIPDEAVIAGYLRETRRVLKPSGRAVLQFDTRPNSRARRLVLSLPDFMLPRTRRRYIRRYPLPPRRPAEMAARAGLGVIEQRCVGTEGHFVLLERGQDEPGSRGAQSPPSA
jgi:SAM-dependent methyltransferase